MRNVITVAMACSMAGSLFAATPVEQHGELKVTGNKILDKNDEVTQLMGPSLFWSVWGGEDFYNKDVIDWIAKDWQASLVRAAIAVEPSGGYLTDSATTLGYATTVIDAAIENGLYVIVDWHDHNANVNVEKAKEFFGILSEKYGDIPNLIWEIWNEPEKTNGTGTNGTDTWADIKAYAEEVIPVIRKHSDNLILVGTPQWCQKVKDAARDQIQEANIAYVLHFYARSHKEWLRKDADTALSLGAALFISEFGMTHADGGSWTNPGIDAVETAKWLDWADKNKLSWANWSLNDKDESSAALLPNANTNGNWPVEQMSHSGIWIRDRIKKALDSNYVPILSPKSTNTNQLTENSLILFAPSLVEINLFNSQGRMVWGEKSYLPRGEHLLNQIAPMSSKLGIFTKISINGMELKR